MFIKWPETPQFWSRLGFLQMFYHREGAVWQPKVKIHGVNTAVILKGTGEYFAQSRRNTITPDDDLYGFASWVYDNDSYFRMLSKSVSGQTAIFGEWYGEGIQSGVAACNVSGRHWAMFCMVERPHRHPYIIPGSFNADPSDIYSLGEYPPEAHPLPWYSSPLTLSNVHDQELIQKFLNKVNEQVDSVSREDPFILQEHGVSGPGEGLVYYPVSDVTSVNVPYGDVAFKAKAEKHRVFKTSESAEIMPINVKTIPQFAEFVLTEERLLQCAREVAKHDCVFEKKMIGPFVAYVLKDVKKESKDVIESNGLRWREVSPEVSKQAKEWYEKMLEEAHAYDA